MSPSTNVAVLVILALALSLGSVEGAGGKVIFAVNAGGPRHIDSSGIEYQADNNPDGIESDFGKRFDIRRVPGQDHILYQTERYSPRNFGYDIPIKNDGKFVLVMKFCEVYFRSAGQKVFDVALNNQQVRAGLDIFRSVGIATAHDEYVEFVVKNKGKTLVLMGQQSSIRDGKIQLRFDRGAADNPKINAFYVMSGSIQDVPKLPAIPVMQEEEEDNILFDDEDEEVMDLGGAEADPNMRAMFVGTKRWVRSGPPAIDPWDFKSTSEKYLPVGIAIGSSFLAYLIVFSVIKF